MNLWQRRVLAFQRRHRCAAPGSPTLPTRAVALLRERLLVEEYEELVDALDGGSLHEIAGECADLIYVVLGTAVSLGIDLSPHFAAVHAANMQKTPGVNGSKATKPPGWTAPDHCAILLRQIVGRRWWNPRSWFRN